METDHVDVLTRFQAVTNIQDIDVDLEVLIPANWDLLVALDMVKSSENTPPLVNDTGEAINMDMSSENTPGLVNDTGPTPVYFTVEYGEGDLMLELNDTDTVEELRDCIAAKIRVNKTEFAIAWQDQRIHAENNQTLRELNLPRESTIQLAGRTACTTATGPTESTNTPINGSMSPDVASGSGSSQQDKPVEPSTKRVEETKVATHHLASTEVQVKDEPSSSLTDVERPPSTSNSSDRPSSNLSMSSIESSQRPSTSRGREALDERGNDERGRERGRKRHASNAEMAEDNLVKAIKECEKRRRQDMRELHENVMREQRQLFSSFTTFLSSFMQHPPPVPQHPPPVPQHPSSSTVPHHPPSTPTSHQPPSPIPHHPPSTPISQLCSDVASGSGSSQRDELIEFGTTRVEEQQNADRHFCLSLVQNFASFNEEQRYQAQIDIIQVLRCVKNMTGCQYAM